MSPLDDDAWDAWSPDDLYHRLRATTRPWYVVGGWALDLWHGQQTRHHEDLEFAVLRTDADRIRTLLHDLDFFTVRDGTLEYLPPFASLPDDVWQVWGADMQRRCWRVDMMIEPGTADIWIYKRDRTLRMPRSEAVRVSEIGIPYLAPINVMLFKAKYCRDKDWDDFRLSISKFSLEERKQLLGWMNQLHPDHEWIASLSIDRHDAP